MIELRAQRAERFRVLLEEAEEFPRNSSRDAILAFGDRVRKAMSAFERKRGQELKQQWSLRRKEIVESAANQVPGNLTIRTEPSKAEVYMDGKLLAITPFTVAQVRSGTHELLVRKSGYRDKKIPVVMERSESVDLGIQELEPIVGNVQIKVVGGKRKDKIEVEIEEFSESIKVGGLEVVQGYQYMEGREHVLKALRIGEYIVIVTRNGQQVARENFVVEEGKTSEVTIGL